MNNKMKKAYSDYDLRTLSFAAASLKERAAFFRNGLDVPLSEDESNTFDKWKAVVLGGKGNSFFEHRLSLENLDENTARKICAVTTVPVDYPTGDWAGELNKLLNDLESHNWQMVSEITAYFDRENPKPFEEFWIPFIFNVRKRVLQRIPNSIVSFVSQEAFGELWRVVLYSLCSLGTMALSVWFKLYLSQHGRLPFIVDTKTEDKSSDRLYKRFIDYMLSKGGVYSFFLDYPVLGRMIVKQMENWTDSMVEFLNHLDADRNLLQECFAPHGDIEKITGLKYGLSDPHNGGRTVTIVEFSSGLKVVYKPKSLETDQVWYKMISWLNSKNLLQKLKVLKVVSCGDHGWMEYIENEPCRSLQDINIYYTRSGMLLCLIYALGGTDCHNENWLASGEFPVLIDTETLLCPLSINYGRIRYGNQAEIMAGEFLDKSVFRTGLLPSWNKGQDGKIFDESGLGAIENQNTGIKYPVWVDINSDWMRKTYQELIIKPQANSPIFKGKKYPPSSYYKELISGFESMYDCLLCNRETLLETGGFLESFGDICVRYVMRPSQFYASLLMRLTHPEFLKRGIDRSIELEHLTRWLIPDGPVNKDFWGWAVYEAELESLERLDIPFFLVKSNSITLEVKEKTVQEDFFKFSGYQDMLVKFKELGPEDRELQKAYIYAAFKIYYSIPGDRHSGHIISPDKEEMWPVNDESCSELFREKMIQTSMDIGEEILDNVVKGNDGSATWIGIAFDPQTERQRLGPLGLPLYEGITGVCFFLAALDSLVGKGRFAELVTSALKTVTAGLKDLKRTGELMNYFPLGAMNGLGSLIYAFVRMSSFLKKEEYLTEAEEIIKYITDQEISEDEHLDIMSGSAGLILCLLSYFEATGNEDVMELVTLCGKNLLKRRVRSESGYRTWKISTELKPLTGFAHGAAGISYALLKLYDKTSDKSFLEAALEGINFENSCFSLEIKNWIDLRVFEVEQNTQRSQVNWCAGSSGIGLGRIGAERLYNSSAMREDIERAVQATKTPSSFLESDHLCCGNAGRIDFLSEAALRTGNSGLLKEALRQASLIICRKEYNGQFSLRTSIPGGLYCPTLFQGTAGIGYTILRLAFPGQLPSVLLLD